MFSNKKALNIETLGGDVLLVEVEEYHGAIILTIGEKRLDIEVNSAYDLSDALLEVANGVQSYAAEA
tara:strand:- start:626 stop:826 length:201 start_codon:yes stop_codon:yes gene_type:complete